jgi:hypothetical protein
MTWKEFKTRVEQQGVSDDDEIMFISVHTDLASDVQASRLTPQHGFEIFDEK